MNNSNEAFKIMNFCRKVAVMSQEDWIREYRNNLTGSDRRKLATIRYINSNPIICLFPWDPTTNTADNPQERTPPLANAVPPNLPVPDQPIEAVDAAGAPVRNWRRRRDSDSDDDYQAPPQRRNAPQQAAQDEESDSSTDTALIVPSRRQQEKERIKLENIQKLLRSFGPKLKYQRHPDSRPINNQPQFETRKYRELLRHQGADDEELIAKYQIDIKENLALAYECESKAVHHHFIVAEKLVMLLEKVGQERFKAFLDEDIRMSLK